MAIAPTDNIVPLLAARIKDKHLEHFAGTGCFVEEPNLLLTADHVIADWKEDFVITLQSEPNYYGARVVHRDQSHDLALLRVEGYAAPHPFNLVTKMPSPNQPVVCLEYGTTRKEGRLTYLNPATRLGNITRLLDERNLFGAAGEDALEISFPALKGASGAPVLTNSTLELVGIMIANISYHLLPAQIERVFDGKEQVHAETQYLMPQGVAVNFRHIAKMLAEYRAKI